MCKFHDGCGFFLEGKGLANLCAACRDGLFAARKPHQCKTARQRRGRVAVAIGVTTRIAGDQCERRHHGRPRDIDGEQ